MHCVCRDTVHQSVEVEARKATGPRARAAAAHSFTEKLPVLLHCVHFEACSVKCSALRLALFSQLATHCALPVWQNVQWGGYFYHHEVTLVCAVQRQGVRCQVCDVCTAVHFVRSVQRSLICGVCTALCHFDACTPCRLCSVCGLQCADCVVLCLVCIRLCSVPGLKPDCAVCVVWSEIV